MDWAFFAVNGLGLNFRRKKLSFGFREKKRSEKIGEIRVTFDNLEKMRKFF